MSAKRTSLAFLISVTAATLCLVVVIMRPFLKPILFALALALVFYPVHASIQKRIRNPNAAALLSTFLVFLVMIVPMIALGRAITRELSDLYSAVSGTGPQGRWLGLATNGITSVLHDLGFTSLDLHSALRQSLNEGSSWMLRQAAALLGGLTGVLIGVLVSAITLFFLFREGASWRDRAASIMPLSAKHVARLFTDVHDMVVASAYGIVAISLLQGFLTGLAFWFLELPSPVLWGVVTGFLSLIPVVGTGGVWIPAALILLAGGHWLKALILVAWGTAIVHPVDNVLRPYLVGQRAKVNATYLFFAILGGVKAFGLIGLLVGPAVLSVTLALVDILKSELGERKLRAAAAETSDSANRGESSATTPTAVQVTLAEQLHG